MISNEKIGGLLSFQLASKTFWVTLLLFVFGLSTFTGAAVIDQPTGEAGILRYVLSAECAMNVIDGNAPSM